MPNLYVHFPFCRRRCAYCSLYSRVGVSKEARAKYVKSLIPRMASLPGPLRTIYFGGGSPALASLAALRETLSPLVGEETEFTVELHPLDVTDEKLECLRSLGVNRISMGVQSLSDSTLALMGRGYTVREAADAFAHVKRVFPNAGIDLIVGYPGDEAPNADSLKDWGLAHCSVYSLQNERGLQGLPPDDWVLDAIRAVETSLASFGLERYEISNYAVRGFECRHNFAVWRGEDYVGLGEGASGRIGLDRTLGGRIVETLSPRRDQIERTIFRLRTREGLATDAFPAWRMTLDRFVSEGLLTSKGTTYFLTKRGYEVCDAILAELVDG